MSLHIAYSRFVEMRRMLRQCPICKQRRRMLGRFQAYYGWLVTCLGCGDSWQDGERMPRPCCRGWRALRINEAKRLYQGVKRKGAV